MHSVASDVNMDYTESSIEVQMYSTCMVLPNNITKARAKNNSAQNLDSSSISSLSEGISGFLANTFKVNVKLCYK